MAPDFRRCFDRALADDRGARGTVRLVGKIDAAGWVTKVEIAHQHGLATRLCECLADVLRSRQFASPDGGGATIIIPVAFFPQEGPPPSP